MHGKLIIATKEELNFVKLDVLMKPFDRSYMDNKIWVSLSKEEVEKHRSWYENPKNTMSAFNLQDKSIYSDKQAQEVYPSFEEYMKRHDLYQLKENSFGFYKNPNGHHTGFVVGGRFHPFFNISRKGEIREGNCCLKEEFISFTNNLFFPEALLIDNQWKEIRYKDDQSMKDNCQNFMKLIPDNYYLVGIDYHY